MSGFTENELFDRHTQALGEAHRACQRLGKNADPEYLAPRGHDYGNLKRALSALEGSARQAAHHRADARWLKLGIIYARVARASQAKFVGQRWNWYNQIMPIFERGLRSMDELKNMKTGRSSNSPIIPARASEWLVLPNHVPATRPPGRIH